MVIPVALAAVTAELTDPLAALAGGATKTPAATKRKDNSAAISARMRLLSGGAMAVTFTFLHAPGTPEERASGASVQSGEGKIG